MPSSFVFPLSVCGLSALLGFAVPKAAAWAIRRLNISTFGTSRIWKAHVLAKRLVAEPSALSIPCATMDADFRKTFHKEGGTLAVLELLSMHKALQPSVMLAVVQIARHLSQDKESKESLAGGHAALYAKEILMQTSDLRLVKPALLTISALLPHKTALADTRDTSFGRHLIQILKDMDDFELVFAAVPVVGSMMGDAIGVGVRMALSGAGSFEDLAAAGNVVRALLEESTIDSRTKPTYLRAYNSPTLALGQHSDDAPRGRIYAH